MDTMLLALLLFAASLIGVLLGTITGLVPGFHPNNVAVILLSFTPAILAEPRSICAALPYDTVLLLLAAIIIAASVAHTFLNFIPAAYFGAPEGETALALLPAHRLLLEGRAYEATMLSAMGSFGAIIFSFLFIIPFFLLFSVLHFYELIQSTMLYLLIGISTLLILTESFSERMAAYKALILSASVFLLSGIFGYVILDMPVHAPFLFSSTMLFPALTGLFGLSTISYSLLHTPEIPEQEIEKPVLEKAEVIKSILSGSISGSLVSFLPGITSAHATVMAMLARRNHEPEQVIVTLSGVNTANVVFCLETLFLISRARSGTTIALSRLLTIQRWEGAFPPSALLSLLVVVLVAAPCSFFITTYLGKQFALRFSQLPYRTLLVGIAFFLVALVLIFTGFLGILVLLVGTCIGLIPICCGVKRSTAMGVLLVPILVILWHM
ncbi:MAG: tripartite tricarboxylate transporter permease [Methanomicrobia archaeon]|nr:tripartite tricarboxylate transporter permease [Methanomicrobia archaeon]